MGTSVHDQQLSSIRCSQLRPSVAGRPAHRTEGNCIRRRPRRPRRTSQYGRREDLGGGRDHLPRIGSGVGAMAIPVEAGGPRQGNACGALYRRRGQGAGWGEEVPRTRASPWLSADHCNHPGLKRSAPSSRSAPADCSLSFSEGSSPDVAKEPSRMWHFQEQFFISESVCPGA